jgi:RNA polymerase sigma-70 factor, ECF subfamily
MDCVGQVVMLRFSSKAPVLSDPCDPHEISATPLLGAEQTRLFERIYRENFDFVFRNIRRAGVADAQADDAVQEVFLVVLRRLSDYRIGSDPKAWLFAIIARVASNHRRSQQRRLRLGALAEDPSVSGAGPFDPTDRATDVRLLHDFLNVLGEDQRNVFILAELEQMTAPEIAAALDVKLNTVYSRLRVAREKLAEYLATHKPEDKTR